MAKTKASLNNKVVAITGAGRGLGAGLAARIIADGGCVAIMDIDAKTVEETARKLGNNARGYVANVTDLDQMVRTMQTIAQDFGRIDVVVANAGILALGSIEHMDPAQFRKVIDVNLMGAFYTLRAAIPHLRETRGYIQVISSLAAAIHTPLMSHYAASKAGVEALADVARQELALDGIGVGCLHPTFVKTNMLADAQKEGNTDKLWGGNKGLFNALEPEQVISVMHKAIIKRERKSIAPKMITPVILAPGLFHWAADIAGKFQGANEAIRELQATEIRNEQAMHDADSTVKQPQAGSTTVLESVPAKPKRTVRKKPDLKVVRKL